MDRRSCLEALGLAAAAAVASPISGWSADVDPDAPSPGRNLRREGVRSRLGLQLFTVRDLLQKDPESTLRAVAAIGYAEVEMFGFGGNVFIKDPLFGHTPRQMRRLLDDCGLRVPSTQIADRADVVPAIAAAAAELGIEHLIIGMPSEFLSVTPSGPVISGVHDVDQIKRLAERLNGLGATCHMHGLGFGYHNHHMEFAIVGGRRAYDLLLELTEPDLVRMELDVGWVTAAGADPLAYLDQHPGRFIACHLKDFDAKRPPAADRSKSPIPDMVRMVAPGDGAVDFPKILNAMDRVGVRHGYVECDLPDDGMDVARRGFRYLSK